MEQKENLVKKIKTNERILDDLNKKIEKLLVSRKSLEKKLENQKNSLMNLETIAAEDH